MAVAGTYSHGELLALIKDARQATVFTGAGISTESGIPDFRSPGGLWTTTMPIQFQDFVRSPDMRKEAWRRKFEMDAHFSGATPNCGHEAVAHLVARGKAGSVITQNIDNLHQNSGVASDRVIELHGNGTFATCLDCSARHELDWVRARFETTGTPPKCAACGGIVKTATISFGQAMPEAEMRRAHEATMACDLFLAIGSSLVVFPAAGFPVMAKRNGARLVIINREPTELDAIADLVINEDIGAVMGPLIDLV